MAWRWLKHPAASDEPQLTWVVKVGDLTDSSCFLRSPARIGSMVRASDGDVAMICDVSLAHPQGLNQPAKVPMVTKGNRLRKRLSRQVKVTRMIFLTERLLMLIDDYWVLRWFETISSVSLIFLDMYQWYSINMAGQNTILLPPEIGPPTAERFSW